METQRNGGSGWRDWLRNVILIQIKEGGRKHWETERHFRYAIPQGPIPFFMNILVIKAVGYLHRLFNHFYSEFRASDGPSGGCRCANLNKVYFFQKESFCPFYDSERRNLAINVSFPRIPQGKRGQRGWPFKNCERFVGDEKGTSESRLRDTRDLDPEARSSFKKGEVGNKSDPRKKKIKLFSLCSWIKQMSVAAKFACDYLEGEKKGERARWGLPDVLRLDYIDQSAF